MYANQCTFSVAYFYVLHSLNWNTNRLCNTKNRFQENLLTALA